MRNKIHDYSVGHYQLWEQQHYMAHPLDLTESYFLEEYINRMQMCIDYKNISDEYFRKILKLKSVLHKIYSN